MGVFNNENILILSALQMEAKPLVKRLGATRDKNAEYLRYQDATERLTIVVTGVGRHRAINVLSSELKTFDHDRVLITGICGGLAAFLNTGDVHIAEQVMTPECPPIEMSWKINNAKGSMLTTEHVLASESAKREAFEHYGTEVVDMETYHLSSACRDRGIPFAVIRAVCDTARMSIPVWLPSLTHENGKANAWGAIKQIFFKPKSLQTMLTMQQATKSASHSLSTKVSALLTDNNS